MYCGACARFASCSLLALSKSAAHNAELAGAVMRKNMLSGGTYCRTKYTVPYLFMLALF